MGLIGRKGGAQERERRETDVESARALPGLLGEVGRAERALGEGHAAGVTVEELHRLGADLDDVLTRAMRAAYARERVLVGPRGYSDRIYRRKRLARDEVRGATDVAERLLTERETHRLHGVERVPRSPVHA